MNKSLKLKLVPFLLIFLSALVFPQTREFVEETYDDGMPKIITIFKQSGNSIIITKRTYWYSNGQKQKEGTYKNGLWNGKWTYWNKQGIRYAEGQFKDGKLHGIYNWYYDSGKKFKQEVFKNGIRHGKSTQWYENSWKQIEGEYVDGKRFGKWIFYNEDRTIDIEKLFGEEI